MGAEKADETWSGKKVSVVEIDLVRSGSGVEGYHWLNKSPWHEPYAIPEAPSLRFAQRLQKELYSTYDINTQYNYLSPPQLVL